MGRELLSFVRSASMVEGSIWMLFRALISEVKLRVGGDLELPKSPPMLRSLKNLLRSDWKLVRSVDIVPVMPLMDLFIALPTSSII